MEREESESDGAWYCSRYALGFTVKVYTNRKPGMGMAAHYMKLPIMGLVYSQCPVPQIAPIFPDCLLRQLTNRDTIILRGRFVLKFPTQHRQQHFEASPWHRTPRGQRPFHPNDLVHNISSCLRGAAISSVTQWFGTQFNPRVLEKRTTRRVIASVSPLLVLHNPGAACRSVASQVACEDTGRHAARHHQKLPDWWPWSWELKKCKSERYPADFIHMSRPQPNSTMFISFRMVSKNLNIRTFSPLDDRGSKKWQGSAELRMMVLGSEKFRAQWFRTKFKTLL